MKIIKKNSLSFLTTYWTKIQVFKYLGWPKDGIFAGELYDNNPSKKVSEKFLIPLEAFLRGTAPEYQKIEHEDGYVSYIFPPVQECERFLINTVLINNHFSFLRFFINTYCKVDEELACSSESMHVAILKWGRDHSVSHHYLPTKRQLTKLLMDMGYTKCKFPGGVVGVWGIAPNT